MKNCKLIDTRITIRTLIAMSLCSEPTWRSTSVVHEVHMESEIRCMATKTCNKRKLRRPIFLSYRKAASKSFLTFIVNVKNILSVAFGLCVVIVVTFGILFVSFSRSMVAIGVQFVDVQTEMGD